jgi:2-amino-4-hydroxy-6-hydroxymethyldihydropteridine diphosphokinase
MVHTIFLSLGSNLGDRLNNLQDAIRSLPPKVQPLSQSRIYETDPWGYTDQPAFLNLVIKANTELAPKKLLVFLKKMEVVLGREETFRYGPRVIDLDILFYDDLVLDSPDLTIPHPRLTERAFVLIPLAELAPDLVHPVIKKTIRQLKTSISTTGIRIFQSPIL